MPFRQITVNRQLALLLFIPLLASCAGPSPTLVPTSAPAASPSGSPGASVPATPVTSEEAPTASPTAASVPAPSFDLARYGWFDFNWHTEGEGTEGPANPTGDTLVDITIGTLAGTPPWRIDLRRKAPTPPAVNGGSPFSEGPFGRYGVYGFTDPAGSQLHRLDLLRRIDTTVLRDPRVIHRAVYDPHTDTYYLALLDGHQLHDLGIWRFRPRIDTAPMRIEAPTGLADAGPGPYRRLYLTPSGDLLVVVDCALPSKATALKCRARSIDSATGTLRHAFGAVSYRITAVTDHWLITDVAALAMYGTASRVVPAMCGAPTVTRVRTDDVLVYESAGPGCERTYYELTSVDLDTGLLRVIYSKRDFRASIDAGLVPFEEHVSLPPGYVLIWPSNVVVDRGAGPGSLLSVADGALTKLPR